MGKEWYVYLGRWGRSPVRPCRHLPKGRSEFRVVGRHYTFLLTALFRFGICVVARVPSGVDARSHDPRIIRWRDCTVKKKSSATVATGAKHLAPVDSDIFSDLLPLVEHCSIRTYDDGDPREPGWFTVKTSGAAWVVQVKDPDGGVSFSAIGETLDKALQTAALLLACDEAPWEVDAFLRAKKKR
jgi:hypothetical protein